MGIQHSRLEETTTSTSTSTSLRSLVHHNEGKLIALLYNQEWDHVISRLTKHPREARMALVLGDSNKPHHHDRAYFYPIHAACTIPNIPLAVLQALVRADPDGPSRYSYTTTSTSTTTTNERQQRQQGSSGLTTLSSGCSSSGTATAAESSFSIGGGGNQEDAATTCGGSGSEWLPLDVAIYNGVSADVCAYLIQQYPPAVVCKNVRGMLPLHLAVTTRPPSNSTSSKNNNNNDDDDDDVNDTTVQVVTMLLEAFPESVYIPTSGGGGGDNNKTAYELLLATATNRSPTTTSSTNKERLLALLHPQQSYKKSKANNEVYNIIQNLDLMNDSTTLPIASPSSNSGNNKLKSLRPRSNSLTAALTSPSSLRPRSNSITAAVFSSSPSTSVVTSLSKQQQLQQQGNPHACLSKLVLAIYANQWDDVIRRLRKKPGEAQVWTLCHKEMTLTSSSSASSTSSSPPSPPATTTMNNDPPCHSLPLFMALRRKAPPSVIQALLEAYGHAAHVREYYGMLPLHVACQTGACVQVVQAIYERYPQAAQVPDLLGMPPLHLACSSEACRVDVICFLLDAHPDSLDVRDSKGFLAIDYVRNGNHPHQRLLETEFGRGIDYWAAKSDVVLIDKMLHRDWDAALERVQSYPQEASRWTKHPIHGKRRYALHYACKYKSPPALVEALLEACPEATLVPIDEYHLLPLHLACSHGAANDVVKLLLECNRETAAIPDSLGLLPLHLAITEGASICVVESLLEAYPNATRTPDKKGFVPYVYAESSHHPSSGHIMELLSTMTIQDDSASVSSATSSSSSSPNKKRQPSSSSSGNNKHARADAVASLLQTKRQKSDRSLQGAAKVTPITV